MKSIYSVNILVGFTLMAYGSCSCLAMDVPLKDETTLPHIAQPQSKPQLIEGTFADEKMTRIQTLLNKLYNENKFEVIVGSIHHLSMFDFDINQSDVIKNLFGSIKNYYVGSIGIFLNYEKCYQLFQNILQKTKVTPEIQTYIRKEFQSLIQINSLAISGQTGDHLLKIWKTVFGSEPTAEDYYHMGILSYKLPDLQKNSSFYLKEYIKVDNSPVTKETIIASTCLAHLDKLDSAAQWLSRLNLSLQEWRNWIKITEETLDTYDPYFSHYVYNFITTHFEKECNIEDYFNKDFSIHRKKYGGRSLVLPEKIPQPFVFTSNKFSFENLEQFYSNFFTMNSEILEKENLSLFALVCLKDLMKKQGLEDFGSIVHTLKYYIKITDLYRAFFPDLDQQCADLLFSISKRPKPSGSSYELGEIAYELFNRHDKGAELLLTKTCGELDPSYKRILKEAKTYFSNSLLEDMPFSRISDAHYYLSLIHSKLNDKKEAEDHLELTHFYNEEDGNKKLAILRSQFAEEAFNAQSYADALRHYKFIEDSLETLEQKDQVLKILCFSKLGYKETFKQEFENFKKTANKNNPAYFSSLFNKSESIQDFEIISLLYKLSTLCDVRNFDQFSIFLKAQYDMQNFEEILTHSESYLAQMGEEARQFDEKLDKDRDADIIELRKSRSIFLLYNRIYQYLIPSCLILGNEEKLNNNLNTYIESLKQLENLYQKDLATGSKEENYNFARMSEDLRSNGIIIQNIFHYLSQPNIRSKITEKLLHNNIKQFTNSLSYVNVNARIYIANLLSCLNRHEEAYVFLTKAVDLKSPSLKFLMDKSDPTQDTSPSGYTECHNTLKFCFSPLLNSLLTLDKDKDLGTFIKYLSEKHNIKIAVKGKRKQSRQGNPVDKTSIQKYLVNSFIIDGDQSYQKAREMQKQLDGVKPTEWGKIAHIDDCDTFLKTTESFLEICETNLTILKKIKDQPAINATQMQNARKANHDIMNNISQFNHRTFDILNTLQTLKKQKERQEVLEKNYQIDEGHFLLCNQESKSEKYRELAKLHELQNEQQKALKELRKNIRRPLQDEYEKNLATHHAEESKELPPHALLIDCQILPLHPEDYTSENISLLHQLLAKKFALDEETQDTLRVILTKGERPFQKTLMDIKKLIAKFEGFAYDIHHGGSHEKISGMGLTFMPNADGNKIGSYFGQLEQAKTKIINIIAKTLTVQDMSNLATVNTSKN